LGSEKIEAFLFYYFDLKNKISEQAGILNYFSSLVFIATAILLMQIASLLPAQNADPPDSTDYKTETIDIDALKSFERFTPVTFENIERDAIEQKFTMQDLPEFLNGAVSINSYSESGSSVGYSYLTLRGFDQRRISILINGIPQNDPEDHQVYWVDVSDITASADNIQIQRGIGTSLYGSSSIGGVINVQTIDYFKRKFMNISGGYGSFNSKRFSAEYSSGLMKNGYAVYGKYTRIKTNGYRDLSWSDHWSFFLSAGKIIGKNSVLKFNIYGSPIKNHLAYLGIDKAYLDGKVTGDIYADRKYNYLTYPDETDNYFQPHYEAVFNQQLSKNIFLSNTFSYIRGQGYFNTFFPVYYGYDFDYFRLNPFYVSDTTTFNPAYYRRNEDGTFFYEKGKGYEIVRSDIVSKLTVNNNSYGWFPKLQISHSKNKGNLVIGGELRFHNSEHFGEVIFGEALPQGTQPNHQYYFYNGGKRTYSVFANELYEFTGKLTAMLGLQYVYHRYNISNDKFKPYDFSLSYNFFTPRAGVNYNFSEKFNAYLNFSIARREPRHKDIYDGENPYSKPNFRYVDAENGIYDDPLVNPETMMDYEAGVSFKSHLADAGLNFYLMDFKDELVSNGQLDNVGQPIVGNAGRSKHIGIEFDFSVRPFENGYFKNFSLTGNLTLSDNYFTDYREVVGADSSGNVIYGNDYSGNQILLSPNAIGNLNLNYTDESFNAFVSLRHVSKQYLDNSENERKNPDARNQSGYADKYIDPYTVIDAGLSYNFANLFNKKYFRKIELRVNADNIFDALYETSGSISFGTPYWIPAATRNLYAEIILGF